jgi:hypothetical protein
MISNPQRWERGSGKGRTNCINPPPPISSSSEISIIGEPGGGEPGGVRRATLGEFLGELWGVFRRSGNYPTKKINNKAINSN